MSGISHRFSIDQSRAQKMLCIMQGFALYKTLPNGKMEPFIPTDDEKANAIAKILSDIGDRISKEDSQLILATVKLQDVDFHNKFLLIYTVLKKVFPHIKIAETSAQEVKKWGSEQLLEKEAEGCHEKVKKTPGFPEEGLPVQDSLAYQVLVDVCQVPAYIAELFLYRVKIGEVIYTFLADPHDIDKLLEAHGHLVELAGNKKCSLFTEGYPYAGNNHFNLEENPIYYQISALQILYRQFMRHENEDCSNYFENLMVVLFGFSGTEMEKAWVKLFKEKKEFKSFRLLKTLFQSSEKEKALKFLSKIKPAQLAKFVRELIQKVLKELKISDSYRSSVETLLKEPKNSEAVQDFYRESGLIREEIMANTLFGCKVPGERIAFIGTTHIPGVVAHLKRLAKSGSVVSSKPDDKKSSDKASPEKDVPTTCALRLEDLIPNTKWSKNAKVNRVWFEGTEAKANEIAEYLNAHGIKVAEPAKTKNSTYLVIISNPDISLIEKLPPYDQWLKKKAEKV